MVAPGFGFSVGDFIAGSKLLISVFSAFKESGGARINSQNSPSQGIEDLLKVIRGPLDEFKVFLDKYEPSLSESSTKSTLGKAPRTIRYAVNDISGKVQALKTQIEQPLQAVNSLLSLHIIKLLEDLPAKPLEATQCAQLVEAIKLADIPAELDKQIQVLQRDAAEHKVKQDEQLQTIKKLRAKLEEKIAKLHAAVEKICDDRNDPDKNANANTSATATVANNNLSNALQAQSTKLSKTIKEHERLIIALKSFLEDKTSASAGAGANAIKSHSAPNSESTPSAGDSGHDQGNKHSLGFSWPSATLPTAHLAIMLLSGVASTVAAATTISAANCVPRPLPTYADGYAGGRFKAMHVGIQAQGHYPSQLGSPVMLKPESSSTQGDKDKQEDEPKSSFNNMDSHNNNCETKPKSMASVWRLPADNPAPAPAPALGSAITDQKITFKSTSTTTRTKQSTQARKEDLVKWFHEHPTWYLPRDDSDQNTPSESTSRYISTPTRTRECKQAPKEDVFEWLHQWETLHLAQPTFSAIVGHKLGVPVLPDIRGGGDVGGRGGRGNRLSKLSTPPDSSSRARGGSSRGGDGSRRCGSGGGGGKDTNSDSSEPAKERPSEVDLFDQFHLLALHGSMFQS
ncbi:hypothetical protein BDW59DRAFT_157909 [Aspergillus cavernicola]|uniref:Uncharacterized protein n=1 Tax=Aspergillus cavernicola TaxID=176166 RepID=A0ABR4IUP2_9EURO